MYAKKSPAASPDADRMGRFLGQLRVHEGITLKELAHGLCTLSHLGRIENGEREVGKQLTDALFQRLGKPVELFERILDWDEFQQWSKRQEILSHLHRGDIRSVRECVQAYRKDGKNILDKQFLQIVEINCRALSGASLQELCPMVREALLLTQPNFLTAPIQTLLLSQNEGRLLFTYLHLREKLEGAAAVSEEYNALLCYFKQKRYESRERVYLFPYVACRVIAQEYHAGNYTSALTVCEDALTELTREKRLFAYDRLLEWKQKLYDAMGNPDRTPEKLLLQLKNIQKLAPNQVELLIPCDERGHVYCLNQVIRDRRKLLKISQEELADGICTPRTLSRIENDGGNLHRKNRRLLLQRVNMSGERYDYEVITDRYEDYLLRSEIGRAVNAGDVMEGARLLSQLRKNIPDIPTNNQYIATRDAKIRKCLPQDSPQKISLEETCRRIEASIHHTLPLDLNQIETWSAGILSINEMLSLITYAFYCKKLKQYAKGLKIFGYLKKCLLNTGTQVSFYDDLYTRIEVQIASILGDLGKYQESNSLSSVSIQQSLENRSSTHIGSSLYNIAWNLNQNLADISIEEIQKRKSNAIKFLKQAYAATIISGNVVMQQHILSYFFKIYGEELTF